MSRTAVCQWKKNYRMLTVKPSYSRAAAKTPFNECYHREFLRKVQRVKDTYDPSCILNADETACRTFPSSCNKVYGFTNSGRKGRQVDVTVDVKECAIEDLLLYNSIFSQKMLMDAH